MGPSRQYHYLFGDKRKWDADLWTSSDDRVRGGKSQSYLDCTDPCKAVFKGNLDIKTLGGAGFASQRTVDSEQWDLSAYQGISLKLGPSDGKKYTLILKDEALPKRSDGRKQSSVSWECDFDSQKTELFIQWDDFKPTYRGKPKKDAKPLDLKRIQRISVMMRSFFGSQQGSFRLELDSIAAVTTSDAEDRSLSLDEEKWNNASRNDGNKKARQGGSTTASWSSWTCGLLRGRI